MKLYVVAVRDRVADVYGLPAFVVSLGAGIRGFADQVNGTDGNAFAAHPDDYDLYEIGVYDDQTGLLEPVAIPRSIAIGKELVVKRN